MKKILIALAALAVAVTTALTGAPATVADPGLCWNGWFWTACISGPGWVDWNPWNNWDDGHWGHGHGHGHGHGD